MSNRASRNPQSRRGFDTGIHGALEIFGVCQRWRRLPYYSLSNAEMEKLADFLGGLLENWRSRL
jgi:hypothetical protein